MRARNGPAIAVDTGVIKHLGRTKQWLITLNNEITQISTNKPRSRTALKNLKPPQSPGPSAASLTIFARDI